MKTYDEMFNEKLREEGLEPEAPQLPPVKLAANYKALSGRQPVDLASLADLRPEAQDAEPAPSVRGQSIAEAFPGVKALPQPSWEKSREQAEKLNLPQPTVTSTEDLIESTAPPEDLSFVGKVGSTMGQMARGLPHIGKALLVDAPMIGTKNVIGALEETGAIPRTPGGFDLKEAERTTGKVGEAANLAVGYAGQQVRHPIKMLGRDPLGTALTLSGVVGGAAGLVGDVAQGARLAKTLGVAGQEAGGSRVFGFAGPRVGAASTRPPIAAEELTKMLRTPAKGEGGILGKVERSTRTTQKVAGELGALPLRAALTPMPWLPASLPSRAAALAAKLPGGAEWMLAGPKRAAVAEALLTRPEMEAAMGKVTPTVGAALGARDAARFAGPDAMSKALHKEAALPPAAHPFTGEQAPMRQITSDLLELPSELEKRRLRTEAFETTGLGGEGLEPGEFIRRKLTREHLPEDFPTQESKGGFRTEIYEVDEYSQQPTGRLWSDPNQVPPDAPAASLRTRAVSPRLPELTPPPEPLQIAPTDPFGGPNLPTPVREGIDFSKHGATTLPGPLPSAAAVGRAGESGLARAQAGEPFLSPPGPPPPARQPIPVMPSPGFSTAGKAQAQAMGEVPGIAPPTLKAPPPLPRLEEASAFKSPPLRAVDLPGALRPGKRGDVVTPPVQAVKPGEFPSLAQPLGGSAVPEVTPVGAPELPFLKPGMEVKTQVRGVESPAQAAQREATASADLNVERMNREAATRDYTARRGAQADLSPEVKHGLDVAMEGRTVIDQQSQRLRQLGIIGEAPVGENLGSYLVRGRSMKLIEKTNPELYAYLQKEMKKAVALEDSAQMDHAMRGVWRHLPPQVQREMYGLVQKDYQAGMIATARQQADLLAGAEFKAALDTPETTWVKTKDSPEPPEGWEQVPDTKTPSGRFEYGSLAGKHIPPQHMRALKLLDKWQKWEPKGPWQASADAWAALKILPPANIGGLFRNLYSFMAGQQVMGRLSAFPDYDGTASAVLKERVRGAGPHVDEFNLFGGGSTIYNPGAARAASVVAKNMWQKAAGPNWNPAAWFQSAVDDAPTWKWWKSRGAQAGGELYGEVDLLGKNLAFSRLRNTQRAYAKGGDSAVRAFRDVEAAFGPDEAVRMLSGGGKEAMEFAGYVGLAYDELPGASQWIAKNVSRFERFPAASSQQIASYLARNPIHARLTQLAGQMGDRMTYQLYWSNPEQGPLDMQMLKEGLGDAMPLGEYTAKDGKRKIRLLPLASVMPQAGLIPAEPKFVDVPGVSSLGELPGYALSPLLGKLSQQPVVGTVLDTLPLVPGFPRVRVPRGPGLFSEDVPAIGTQDVSGMGAGDKFKLVASDVAKRWGLPSAYHVARGIRGLQGVEDPATGEPVSLPEAATKGILGLGFSTADMDTMEDRFGQRGKSAISAVKATQTATAKRAEERGEEITPEQETEFQRLFDKYERQMAPLEKQRGPVDTFPLTLPNPRRPQRLPEAR